MAATATPNQGFRFSGSLAASGSTDAAAVVCSPGKSRGGGIQLSGTFVGTVQFEQSLDNGTTWIAKTVYPATGGAGVTSATATGQWKFQAGGESYIRARCSAFTSGPIVVDIVLTAGSDPAANSGGTTDTLLGAVTETAPATDTASSGLNGRLQRIAQRLTTIYAYFTSGVVGGGITYTDKTITSATGSSQTLAASNASRKSILIKNGASNTGVNLNGGTAAIGGAATLTLQPFEPLFLSGADCPAGAITVISTAAAYISALEGA